MSTNRKFALSFDKEENKVQGIHLIESYETIISHLEELDLKDPESVDMLVHTLIWAMQSVENRLGLIDWNNVWKTLEADAEMIKSKVMDGICNFKQIFEAQAESFLEKVKEIIPPKSYVELMQPLKKRKIEDQPT
jgi:hypothetical protein